MFYQLHAPFVIVFLVFVVALVCFQSRGQSPR